MPTLPTAEELAGVVKQAESDSLYGSALIDQAFRHVVTALVAEANSARQRISALEAEAADLRERIYLLREESKQLREEEA